MKPRITLLLLLLACMSIVNARIVEIGDPMSTNSSNASPLMLSYNYSAGEMIYQAGQIGTAGDITSIAFEYMGEKEFSMEGVQVYMRHINESSIFYGQHSHPLRLKQQGV